MKTRMRIFVLVIIVLAAIPISLNLNLSRPVVQSVNDNSTNSIIYDNALSPNWENWSWNSDVSFDSTDNPYAGSKTIFWKSHNWGGLYLHVKNNESIDTTRFDTLQFSLKATQANQSYSLVVYNQDNQPIGSEKNLSEFGGPIPGGEWKTYSVPMQLINPNRLPMKGIVLQSKSDHEQQLFVDEIHFIPKPEASHIPETSENLPIYTDTLDERWENWSWDSTVVLNETFKTESGKHSIAYTPHAPWAALYLHAKQPIDTSGYSALTFSIYASQPDQQFAIAAIDDQNSITTRPQKLSEYGGQPTQNAWKTYSIPLHSLGAKDKKLIGLILQNIKNSSQPIVYVDSIFLTKNTSNINSQNSQTLITITPTPSPLTIHPSDTQTKTALQSTNPFVSSRLYVNPNNPARKTIETWRQQGRDTDAQTLSKISDNPTAFWAVGDHSSQAVHEYVTQAHAENALPVLVAYNIPGRDCGQYSQGGTTYEGYKSWIQSLAQAIGDRDSVVILEPDALGLDCLQNANTYSLLKFAVETLESKPKTSVYIEAASWVNPEIMADRLQKSGIQQAQGFAINTSGYNTTDSMVAYGNKITTTVGKKFVIDTSRNGRGPYDASDHEAWCNPPERGLGNRPTAQTGLSNVDAFLWIKVPGESDGTCRGGPSAGSWWESYALGLAQRSSF